MQGDGSSQASWELGGGGSTGGGHSGPYLPEEGGWNHTIRGWGQATRASPRQVTGKEESGEEISWIWTTGVLGVVVQDPAGTAQYVILQKDEWGAGGK